MATWEGASSGSYPTKKAYASHDSSRYDLHPLVVVGLAFNAEPAGVMDARDPYNAPDDAGVLIRGRRPLGRHHPE